MSSNFSAQELLKCFRFLEIFCRFCMCILQYLYNAFLIGKIISVLQDGFYITISSIFILPIVFFSSICFHCVPVMCCPSPCHFTLFLGSQQVLFYFLCPKCMWFCHCLYAYHGQTSPIFSSAASLLTLSPHYSGHTSDRHYPRDSIWAVAVSSCGKLFLNSLSYCRVAARWMTSLNTQRSMLQMN